MMHECGGLGLRLFCDGRLCAFKVTGRESFKAERALRPVKIAESDADVSESLI